MADAKPTNNNEQYIFTPYVVRKGKVIYPKKAKVFRIPLSRLKKRKR